MTKTRCSNCGGTQDFYLIPEVNLMRCPQCFTTVPAKNQARNEQTPEVPEQQAPPNTAPVPLKDKADQPQHKADTTTVTPTPKANMPRKP